MITLRRHLTAEASAPTLSSALKNLKPSGENPVPTMMGKERGHKDLMVWITASGRHRLG